MPVITANPDGSFSQTLPFDPAVLQSQIDALYAQIAPLLAQQQSYQAVAAAAAAAQPVTPVVTPPTNQAS